MDAAFPAHLSNRQSPCNGCSLQTTGGITKPRPSNVSAEAQVTATHRILHNDKTKKGGGGKLLILYNVNSTFHIMEHLSSD